MLFSAVFQFSTTVYSFVSPGFISGIIFLNIPSCSSHVPSLLTKFIPSGSLSSIVTAPSTSPLFITLILYTICIFVFSTSFLYISTLSNFPFVGVLVSPFTAIPVISFSTPMLNGLAS